MSLPPAALVVALGMAQATTVAPALDDGGYAQGTAGTIAMVLLMLAQDLATADDRRARETAAMRALLSRDGGDHSELLAALDARLAVAEAAGERDVERAILDLLVDMTEAAFVPPPAL